MAGKFKVTSKDNGHDALIRRIGDMKKGAVDVGIFADSGAKDDSPDLTVLEVAIFNEFGLGVPERSFLRAYVDENEKKIKEYIKKFSEMIVAGKITKEQALEQLGLKIVGEIQQRISKGIDPPNAPSTIAKKGSATPLVNLGQLRSSVTHKVRK